MSENEPVDVPFTIRIKLEALFTSSFRKGLYNHRLMSYLIENDSKEISFKFDKLLL